MDYYAKKNHKNSEQVSVNLFDKKIEILLHTPCKLTILDTKFNRKLIYILLRLLTNFSGKPLLVFAQISELFGFKKRQNMHNFYMEFKECGSDFYNYLSRKIKLKEYFSIIEKQVLKLPLLSISEHYRIFKENNDVKMSLVTFSKYFARINSSKLLNKIKKLINKKELSIKTATILKEILNDENLPSKSRKKIIDILPGIEKDIKPNKDPKEDIIYKNVKNYGKIFILMFLIGCGLDYKVLSLLFGVSKSTIHNWFYQLPSLKEKILQSIVHWSGKITVDEKWIKINKERKYIFSIVDDTTGFLLYFKVMSDTTTDSWMLFFQRFYQLYGKPKLIISDGCPAIAGAIKTVFPKTKHQLCKFHKLKNLFKRIYNSFLDEKSKKRAFRLGKNIFGNTTYFGRKNAARKLAKIKNKYISNYVKNNILKYWKKLTMSKTSNSAERFNRKIDKIISKKYGLKSEKYVEQLIACLWLKEAIFDNRHLKESFIKEINISKFCQENLKTGNIIDLMKDKLFKKAT